MSRASKNLLDRTFQSSRAANRSHQVSDRSLKQESPLTRGGQPLVCLHERPFSELHGLSRPGRRRPRRNRRWLRQRCPIYPCSQRFWRSRRCWRGRERLARKYVARSTTQSKPFPTHNPTHRMRCLVRLTRCMAVPAVLYVIVKPNHATLIRARSVVQVHPGPPFKSTPRRR